MMQAYKADFIDATHDKRALGIGEFKLKSGRISPYFFNSGMFNDGDGLTLLGDAYAAALFDSGLVHDGDVLYGPPDKGTALAIEAAAALWRQHSFYMRYAYRRTKPKDYGDAAGSKAKGLLVGHPIGDNDRVAMLDDVFTTGDTKYEAVDFIHSLGEGIEVPVLVIAVDRQETNAEGRNAVADFEERTGIPVKSIVSASEIFEHMENTGRLSAEDAKRFDAYLRQYGVEGVRDR